MIGKLKWIITGICFAILKKTLRYRLKGSGVQWVQALPFLENSIVNREEFIIDFCKDKSVLHIGFTDYPFTAEKLQQHNLLHTKIKKKAKFIFGIDNNQNSINEYVKLSGDTQVRYADILNEYPNDVLQHNYDVVVFAEVLEHLQNPAKAIALMANTFKANTKILVTVPSYTSLDSISASLNKTESIHPHHYWYFSPYTLNKLFAEHGFVCEKMCFGMYYNTGIKINQVLQHNAFNGDCIVAIFSLNEKLQNE
jgi:SAM-dependent methyltransferase